MRKDSYQRLGLQGKQTCSSLTHDYLLVQWTFFTHFQFIGRASVWNDRTCFGPKFRLALVGQAIS